MKKLRGLFLLSCLAVLFCFSRNMDALGSVSLTPSDADPFPPPEEARAAVRITALPDQEELASLPSVLLPLRSSASAGSLEKIYRIAIRYQTVDAVAISEEGSRRMALSVAWDFSDIDQTTAGQYDAVGKILLPEGYVFDENVLQELRIHVLVKELPPAAVLSVEPWHPYTDAFALPRGSSLDVLEKMFSFSPYMLKCYTDDGDSYVSTVEWDFSAVDPNTPGVYLVSGTLPAPEGTFFTDDLALPEISIPVSIQEAGRPELNCLFLSRGSLCFPWVTPPGGLEQVHVYLSENEGPWICMDNDSYITEEFLSLFTYSLTPRSSYRLQAFYDGGQTGILSFIYSDHIILEGYHEGDRDGGDADGNQPQDMVQPGPPPPVPDTEGGTASSPDGGSGAAGQEEKPSRGQETEPASGSGEAENSQTEEPFLESFSRTSDRISGVRFLMMLQAGNQHAVFSKQGITLRIPGDALPVSVKNTDQICLTIQKRRENGFFFGFSINDASLEALPGVTVMLPCPRKPEEGTLFLTDQTGTEYPMTAYDDAAKAAVFQIGRTGSYTMTFREAGKALPEETASLTQSGDSIAPPAETAGLTQGGDSIAPPAEAAGLTQNGGSESSQTENADPQKAGNVTLPPAGTSGLTQDGDRKALPEETAAGEPEQPSQNRFPWLPAVLPFLPAGIFLFKKGGNSK